MSQYKAAYRKLFKTALYVFGKDYQMIDVARKTMKEEFRKNQNVTDAAALKACYASVDDVEEMLRYNIMQGVKNEKGNFHVDFRPEHHVAIEQAQHLTYGLEINPIDRSYIGEEVVINKVTASDMKEECSSHENCTDPTHKH